MLRGVLKENHIVSKGLVLFGLMAIGFSTGIAFTFLLAQPLLGIDLIANPELLQQITNPEMIGLQRLSQFFNSLGAFILPVLFFAYLVEPNWKKYLSMNYLPQLIFFGLAAGLMILFLPWINLMAELNMYMQLPEFLSPVEDWIRMKEDQAEKITGYFLTMNSVDSYLVNLVVMAVVPALGEELLFRGVIQQQLTYRFKNHHLGIWVSAILFSAIHLQFFGFFPRMFLGAFFGYMLVWTRSIWVPVLAHFLNNAAAVSLHYFLGSEKTASEIDSFGTESNDWFYLLVSGILLFSGLRFMWRIRVRSDYE